MAFFKKPVYTWHLSLLPQIENVSALCLLNPGVILVPFVPGIEKAAEFIPIIEKTGIF